MIRPIDIRLNAAHPELPLAEAVTFTGSPSTVLVRGVPPNCGRWAITAVFVAATYPDGSTTTRAAVQSANGVWVATLPATARSGRTENGLRVMADGIDENGAAVTGYILGVADFAVASLGVTPAPEPGETSWQMLYFDAVPGALRKGDVAKVDGVLKLYNGTAWEPFAGDIPAPSTATPAMDGTGAAGTSAAYARGDHVHPTDTSRVPTSRKVNGKALTDDVTLTGADIAVSGSDPTKISAALAGKASTADATLTERGPNHDGFSAWTVTPSTYDDGTYVYDLRIEWFNGGWCVASDDPVTPGLIATFSAPKATAADTTISWVKDVDAVGDFTATRTALQGYQLGSQTDKPLASEAEAEALRTGKQDALTPAQLANIAAVSDALSFDATHTYYAGDPVVYNGTLYTFTATHTGAWTGSDVSAVDIIARLANVVHKTGDETIEGQKTFNGAVVVNNDISNYNGFLATMGITLYDVARGYVGGDNSDDHLIHIRTFEDTDLGLPAGDVTIPRKNGMAALTADIPYSLGTPIVIDEASSETVEGETVYYGAATLANRTANVVQVTAATALDELRITFPAATSGKVRDFGLRVEIGTGSAALTAPALVPIAPTGETIKIENNAKEIPALADGTATAKGVTLLYFSENAPGVFVVKGEQVEEVA